MNEATREEALNEFLAMTYVQHRDRNWMRFCKAIAHGTGLTLVEVKRKYYDKIVYGEWEDMKFELVRDWNNYEENN